MEQKQRILGVFALAMINVAAIISLRNLPFMASFGLSALFFYLVAALLFLIPVALVCAELATTYPDGSGTYDWVRGAFGPKWGLFAIWTAWMESIAWFPAMLAFVVSTMSFVFAPSLAQDKIFMLEMLLFIFWFFTFINFFGIKVSSVISTVGVIIGSIVPGFLIIILGLGWVFSGRELNITLHYTKLLPSFEIQNLVLFAGVLLGFAGLEVSAFHAKNARNPQRDYPRAIFFSAFVILFISVLGTLAISVVVPNAEITLLEGVMQAFAAFFAAFNIQGATKIIALMVVIGGLAGINTWLIGPAKGILAAKADDLLPHFMHQTNKHNAPVVTLVLQAIIGSILSFVVFFTKGVEVAYWILTVISAQCALIMYMMIFASALKLRYKHLNINRVYRISNGRGNLDMWCLAVVGIVVCGVVFLLGFVPPAQLKVSNFVEYTLFLVLILLTLLAPPFILYKLRRANKRN